MHYIFNVVVLFLH